MKRSQQRKQCNTKYKTHFIFSRKVYHRRREEVDYHQTSSGLFTLKTETVSLSETLVPTYQYIRRKKPEQHHHPAVSTSDVIEVKPH